ncbi:MAG TPA: hypothetical protein VME46_08325 [Acidimicrobiales bacterium]|nr:hypothetical protein [Acidimicrobiales bacterium]
MAGKHCEADFGEVLTEERRPGLITRPASRAARAPAANPSLARLAVAPGPRIVLDSASVPLVSFSALRRLAARLRTDKRWGFEDTWTVLHELAPPVECPAGDQVERDVGVAVVDAF